ncbi:MAG: di-trans,poly-cis-decaprenylcistransferase [Clostridia bacterium]|nr:di-trans,poly-cis-decaprenylcistransferase [Clostridia bacterium]
MDGNGRWAESRGLPRNAGHARGSENFDRIATLCSELGIRYLTVYAFSTENWKRDPEEVRGIFDLFRKYLKKSCDEMLARNVKLRIFGDTSAFPEDILALIGRAAELSEQTTGMQVNVCINYGGRDEIVHAAKSLACDAAAGRISPEDVDAAAVEARLYSAGVPDPDLLIRTGGDMRVSNFLLWQIAYSELYVTDTLWPAFSGEELCRAIISFAGRDRRFGGYGKSSKPRR